MNRSKIAVKLFRFTGSRLFSGNQPSGNGEFSAQLQRSNKEIISEKYKAVTIISLNRPDKKNALNKSMLNGLAEAIRNFDNDASSSVGILCGVGGNFSVGYDLDELCTAIQNKENILENITFQQNLTDKPMICCISGYCCSIALELALMCDIRLAEESSMMQFTNRRLGIPLVNVGTQRLVKLISLSRALDVTLTGREIRGIEAHEIGLANCVVTDGSCLGRVLSTAMHMSSFPQSTLKYDKRNLYSPSTSTDGIKVLPPDILNDINAGLEFEFSEKKLTYMGSKKATRHFKLENMPDWEQDEFAREIEYMHKTKTEPKIE